MRFLRKWTIFFFNFPPIYYLGCDMSEAIAAIYALFVIGASLVTYFKFMNKRLDKMLDRAFASWHIEKELEEQMVLE